MLYSSVFEDVKEARLNKPQKGHLKKAGDSPEEVPEGVPF